MSDLLSALYAGELYPAEQYTPRIEAYRKLYREHLRQHEAFAEMLRKLDPQLEQQFIEILEQQLDEVPLEIEDVFIEGFRLGAKLIIEIYRDDTYSGEK